jgi:hypothetical protein
MIGYYRSTEELRREIRAAQRRAGLAPATPAHDWTSGELAAAAQDCRDLLKLASPSAPTSVEGSITMKLHEALRQFEAARC